MRTRIGAARTGRRLRLRAHSQADPRNINDHTRGIGPAGKWRYGAVSEAAGAVVPICKFTTRVLPTLICTDVLAGMQVGAAVTAGVTAQLRLTVPANDPVGATCRPKLSVCPVVMGIEVRAPEPKLIEKSGAGGAACTTSDVVTLSVTDPATPRICTAYVPAAVLDDVVMVSVEVFELLLIDAGLNAQLNPVGKPMQESVSAPLDPKMGMAVKVEVAEPPAITRAGEGELADSAKPGGVVLSSNPMPGPQRKTISGFPSPFISATKLVNG